MNEKEIEQYLKEVLAEIEMLRIPIAKNIAEKISINKRAKKRFGCCIGKRTDKGLEYRIELSEMVLSSKKEAIKETLVHELLHTCPGCNNHGRQWKNYAEQMNCAFGYDIKRVSTFEELGIDPPKKEKRVRYQITCANCGKVFQREKRSKLVTDTTSYRCRCGGMLTCKEVQIHQ